LNSGDITATTGGAGLQWKKKIKGNRIKPEAGWGTKAPKRNPYFHKKGGSGETATPAHGSCNTNKETHNITQNTGKNRLAGRRRYKKNEKGGKNKAIDRIRKRVVSKNAKGAQNRTKGSRTSKKE